MEDSVIDRIETAMASDDADRCEQSERLRALYASVDPTVRAAIDEAMICICGWRLATLLARSGTNITE